MGGIRKSIFRCPGSLGANPIILAGLSLQASPPAMAALQLHSSKRQRSPSVQQGASALWWTQRVLHKAGLSPQPQPRLRKCSFRDVNIFFKVQLSL